MAAIDTSLLPSGNVRFQMAAMPEPTDPLVEEQRRLANQTAAQNLATAKYNAQKQKLFDAMADVVQHETPADTNAAIDRYVADGTLTAAQAADAKSKVPPMDENGNFDKDAFNKYKLNELLHYSSNVESVIKGLQENERLKRISDIMGMGAAPAPAAPTNALAPAPVNQEQALFNQLNPQPAAPAAAPTTNALVSSTAQGVDVNALRNRINALYMMGEDKLAASLEDQLPKTPTETEFDRKWNLFKLQYPNGTYEQFVKLSQTPGTSVTVKTGEDASVALAKQMGQKVADEMADLNTKATSAVSNIKTSQLLLPLVNDPKFISGTLGETRLAVAKALGLSGAEATQTFFAGIGKQVAENVKSFGSGTAISDADRAYAEKIAGGSIELTPSAIKKIMDLNDKYSQMAIDKYNSRKKFLSQKNPTINDYYEDITSPSKPAAGAPVKVNSKAELDKLKSGTLYIGPDNVTRIKP